MPQAFVYNPQRDAFKAIRGFYYQIQLTVIRWLELPHESVLICECGEDIDHLSRLPDADAETQRRILEQVKLRDRITLRSTEALSALVRFREAVTANPAIHLRYRLSTTATVGREQSGGFPRGLPGIEAWSLTVRGQLTREEEIAFVDALKRVVADSRCPPDLPSATYASFQTYVANTNGTSLVRGLVHPFEWATGLLEPPRLLTQIHTVLLQQGRANTDGEAAYLADVLLMHVFRLLTASGEKRLTVDGLDQLLRERSLTEVDRRILTSLTRHVEQAEAYLTQMVSQINVISQGVVALQAMPGQLDQLAGLVSDVQMQLAITALPPPDEPPVITGAFTERRALLRELANALRDPVWLSIEGATGMGKTYAAKLLADRLALDTVWISLRGERLPAGIHRRIDLHLLRHTGDPSLGARFVAGDVPFSRLAAHAAQDANLIVIDELPELVKEPALADRLLILTRALSERGGKLVTTTTSGIPQRTIDELGEELCRRNIPPMDASEVEDILRAEGTPAVLRQQPYLDMIRAVTHGHPVLVSAVVAFLRRRSWAISPQDLMALVTGDVARGIKSDTVRNVANLVSTAEARELLYRLSLVAGEFDRELVFDVARVPPEVLRPGENLLELIGPWLNRRPNDRMEVSPLLSGAAYEVLAAERVRDIHRAVAIHLAKKHEVDPDDALQIIVHAAGGAHWELLVGFALRLAMHIRNRAHAEALRIVTLLFTSSWPDDMPPHFRIMFRAVQVRLLMLLGEDDAPAARDLDRLMLSADRDAAMAVLTALFLIGPMNPAASPGVLARRVLQAGRVLADVPPEVRRHTDAVPFQSLIWMGVTRIRNLDDIRDVLNVLREMTPEERRASFGYAPLADAPQLFVDQCWMLEVRKAEQDRDWDSVITVLDEVRQVVEMPGGSTLRAPEARARAVVLADHLARYEEAMEAIERGVEDADPDGRFLLDYTAGCILLDHSTATRSLERFQRALGIETTAHRFLRVDAGRLAAEAAGRSGDWPEAIKKAKVSVFTIESEDLEPILRYERLEMIGELAWAHWSAGDARKACAAMSAVVRSVARAPQPDHARYREVFLKAGHVLGWMAAVAKHSEPPTHGADGSPYTEPFPGILSRPRAAVADARIRSLVHVLLTQLGLLAAGVGFPGLARKSLLAAREVAEASGFGAFCQLVDLELAEVAAAAGDYAEATRRGISGVRALAIRRRTDRSVDLLGGTLSLDGLWAALDESERRDIERGLFFTIVGPAVTATVADSGRPDVNPLCDRLDQLFSDSAGQLADVEHWRRVVRELRVAFSPLATRDTVRSQLKEHSGDTWMSALLYLALGDASDSTLEESCGRQAVAFEVLLRMRPVSDVMVRNVTRYILRFWQRAGEREAFALRRPGAFRAAVESLPEESPSSAVQALLLAAEATGVILGAELVQSLTARGAP
ncbi:MAG: hypothetical protein HY682_07240 [Chloroflexi bacterium]|nr:hypothetical protein [Chloroflexota bacterium]